MSRSKRPKVKPHTKTQARQLDLIGQAPKQNSISLLNQNISLQASQQNLNKPRLAACKSKIKGNSASNS
jgi:hypothetical protein